MYTKTNWSDRVVQNPSTYTMRNNPDGTITLIPAPGMVQNSGTPIKAEYLNNMENGIEDAHKKVDAHYHTSLGSTDQKFVVVVDEDYNLRPNSHRGANLGTASCAFRKMFIHEIYGHDGADLTLYPGDAQWGGVKLMGTGYLIPTRDRVMALGSQNYRFHSLYLMNAPTVSSDQRDKVNINYLNGITDESFKVMSESISMNDLYEFVKNDLKIATFDYKSNRSDDTHNIGFIAQDIVDTVVGSRVVNEAQNGKYEYNLGSYISTIAGALQVAINKIDELERMGTNAK